MKEVKQNKLKEEKILNFLKNDEDISWELSIFEEIGSTNDYLLENSKKNTNLPHMLVEKTDWEKIVSNMGIRVYNKIGQAYGTSVDNALIKNYQDNIEFILTATIYTIKNKVVNDNVYEYEEIGIPFLARLSRSIYNQLSD